MRLKRSYLFVGLKSQTIQANSDKVIKVFSHIPRLNRILNKLKCKLNTAILAFLNISDSIRAFICLLIRIKHRGKVEVK